VTFAEYFVLLRRHWRTWAVCIVIALIAAVAYNTFAPVRYTAVTTSFVTMSESANATPSDVFQGSQFTAQRLKSYAPLGTSPEVLQPVINRLHLDTTVRALRGTISVSSPPDTVLLQVSATSPSPRQAVRIADAVSAVLGQRIEILETPRVRGVSLVDVTITHPAELPIAPSSPRKLLDLMIAVIAGAAIGLIAALIRNHFGRRIETARDLETLTGVPPLGSTLPSRRRGPGALVTTDVRSAAAEQYRTIRSAITLNTVSQPNRSLVISSAARHDGKTTVATNLAISWAQAGASVCLVEADLRGPAAARLLGIQAGTGLADVLLGKAKLEDVLRLWSPGPVTVLPAGHLPPDPTALLGSERMQTLVGSLARRFDVVIYDSPSLLPVVDALLLSQTVGGLIMVARSGATAWDDFDACLERVRTAGLDLVGVIANASKERSIRGQYWSRPKTPPSSGDTGPATTAAGITMAELPPVRTPINGAVKRAGSDRPSRGETSPGVS
jgi:capsular exopolysaccharide synthesis family protein